MRIILSRKGFDSSAGGGASPIVAGRPVSLPIPAGAASQTTYGDLGLGEHAAKASRGKLNGEDLCHHDPMFRVTEGGARECLLGQCGAAQTHLERQGVGKGDIFLFFGLYREPDTGELHHRIFGCLEIEDMTALADGVPGDLAALGHPHALAMHHRNDVIYRGPGTVAAYASPGLRLTVEGGPPSLWKRPRWLRRGGLSYHDKPQRWLRRGCLQSAARGQEFVADIGRRQAPRDWLAHILAEVRAS